MAFVSLTTNNTQVNQEFPPGLDDGRHQTKIQVWRVVEPRTF